jgi:predicted transcriptional regulator
MRFRIDTDTLSYRMIGNNQPITTMTLRPAQECIQLLVAAKISQALIAERAGIRQPTISRILAGKHKDPKGSVLVKLNEFAAEVETKSAPESQPQ